MQQKVEPAQTFPQAPQLVGLSSDVHAPLQSPHPDAQPELLVLDAEDVLELLADVDEADVDELADEPSAPPAPLVVDELLAEVELLDDPLVLPLAEVELLAPPVLELLAPLEDAEPDATSSSSVYSGTVTVHAANITTKPSPSSFTMTPPRATPRPCRSAQPRA